MAEYGCYPSFMVTASDNHSLTDTPLEDYFSLNFDNWYPQIEKIYNRLNEVLSMVEGQYIVEHKAIGVGVYRVTYSGGTVIYVNRSPSRTGRLRCRVKASARGENSSEKQV